jgi:hypothetical protein
MRRFASARPKAVRDRDDEGLGHRLVNACATHHMAFAREFRLQIAAGKGREARKSTSRKATGLPKAMSQ